MKEGGRGGGAKLETLETREKGLYKQAVRNTISQYSTFELVWHDALGFRFAPLEIGVLNLVCSKVFLSMTSSSPENTVGQDIDL